MYKKYPTFKEFTSGNYSPNLKMAFIHESITELPPNLVYLKLLECVNDDDFVKFKNSINLFKNSINKVNESLIGINEKTSDTGGVALGHGNPTGKGGRSKGGLKALVGKPADVELATGDAAKIGKIIAGYKGEDIYGEYIGMLNFLDASCKISGEIRKALEASLNIANSGKKLDTNYSPEISTETIVQEPIVQEPIVQEPIVQKPTIKAKPKPTIKAKPKPTKAKPKPTKAKPKPTIKAKPETNTGGVPSDFNLADFKNNINKIRNRGSDV